jgi:hypothetical protein
MNRTLSVRRLYTLGDYKNITFEDTIAELPESIMLNPEITGELQYLQLINLEYSIRKYKEVQSVLGKLPVEDEIGYLEQVKSDTLSNIRSLLADIK